LHSAESIYTLFLQHSVKHEVTISRREEEGEGVGKGEREREVEEGGLAGGRDNFQK
jgi:hypothetical protein